MQHNLQQLEGQVFNHAVLAAQLKGYARPNDKISNLLGHGELLPLKRGLYALPAANGQISRGLIANHLYGPSYVSAHWMLAHYGWVSERVQEVTSMCMERSRYFDTPLGRFSYATIPVQYYATGLTFIQEGEVAFMAATPEKALCDLLVSTRKLRIQSVGGMEDYLLNDLRLDEDDLIQLDLARLHQCAGSGYKMAMLAVLVRFIQGLQHD
ncbi:MAG: hypothetical protein R3F02_13120 [Thiolinea sp.]